MSRFKVRRRRRNSRKQFIIISIGLIVFVFILGTAYSAFSTNLSINASGSIKEHTYTIENLKNLVVTSGDGLYEDDTEDGRYVYKGSDPNNYVMLGDDLFRIIAIETDGTLKVVSNNVIATTVSYDPGYETVISDDILTTEANSITGTRYSSDENDYCYASSESNYYGCNVWGSNETTLDSSGNNVQTMSREIDGDDYNLPDTEAYINMYLNQIYYESLDAKVQAVIEKHLFNIGTVSNSSSFTLEESMAQEQACKWNGKVGLVSVTDYIKANSNTICNNIYENTTNGNYNVCKATTWLYKSNYYWLISPSIQGSYYIWAILTSGHIHSNNVVDSTSGVYPVMYLSSSITLQGDGSQSSPYEIIS